MIRIWLILYRFLWQNHFILVEKVFLPLSVWYYQESCSVPGRICNTGILRTYVVIHFSFWNTFYPRYHIRHFVVQKLNCPLSSLKSCYWQWFTVTVRSFTSNPNGSDNSGSHILGMNLKGTGTLTINLSSKIPVFSSR